MKNEFEKLRSALDCLSNPFKEILEKNLSFVADKVTEIHLRVNQPFSVTTNRENYCFMPDGTMQSRASDKALICLKSDVEAAFNRICRYSVYSVQNELINGFITISGGHRAGVCGTAVVNSGEIVNIRDISSINIRISREVIGCCESLVESVGKAENGVLICGEPCSGKTTILRDLSRYISKKENKKVSLIDERGELAASISGVSQNDVGFCDVFSGYPKHRAVEQALRCMSPDYIICDELGTTEDVSAVEGCVNSGVSVIAAMHASNPRELLKKPNAERIVKTGAFESVVFLDSRKNIGKIKQIITSGDLLDP